MENHIIIVAGGRGTRMLTDLPKQFLEISGKPVLMHSVERMREALPDAGIVVVLPEDQISFWNELIADAQLEVEHKVVAGGASRTESVRNGLAALKSNEGVVGIHDGVRPCFSLDMVKECFAKAEEVGAAIPAFSVTSSLRKITDNGSKAVDRSLYKEVQTPQCFNLKALREAYSKADQEYSDDASLMEALGHTIHLVEGDRDNIKITYPSDIAMAELTFSLRS